MALTLFSLLIFIEQKNISFLIFDLINYLEPNENYFEFGIAFSHVVHAACINFWMTATGKQGYKRQFHGFFTELITALSRYAWMFNCSQKVYIIINVL